MDTDDTTITNNDSMSAHMGTSDNDVPQNEDTREVDIEAMSPERGTHDFSPSEKVVTREVGIEQISTENEIQEVGEAFNRLELDIACCSEKLINLNLLMMLVATKESEFEVFTSNNEDSFDCNMEVVEFDILSGIFDLEVKEMGTFIGSLEKDVDNSWKVISCYKHLGGVFLAFEEKLRDVKELINQLKNQVSELMIESSKFQMILSSLCREETFDEENGVNSWFGTISEHQKHLLKMLKKSSPREFELKNELIESLDNIQNELKSSQQETMSGKEETLVIYSNFLEADSASTVLMGISKELIGKLQLSQFELNNALHRENEMNQKLQDYGKEIGNLEKKEAAMRELAEKNGLEVSVLNEKVNSLENDLKILESSLINEKNSRISIEKQLLEREVQRQEAMAVIEASQERETMLLSSISDMEILIEKLKSQVSEANARADSAEDKLIILSESHSELNEEVNFLRGKMGILEGSLQKVEETKRLTAKDINIRTKVITNMVMQLAVERERLQKQLSILMIENRALVDKLHVANKVSSNHVNYEGGETKKGNKEDYDAKEVEKSQDDISGIEGDLDSQDIESKLETVRTIDAGRLNTKHVFSAILIALIGVMVLYLIMQPEN